MDSIQDVHRSNFCVPRADTGAIDRAQDSPEAGYPDLLHLNTLIADPDFNEPDLVSRLQVRIRQLQDAYATFHDSTLSDAQAENVLKQVFPE